MRVLCRRFCIAGVFAVVFATAVSADVTLRLVQHLSAGLLGMDSRVTWYQKGDKFAEYEEAELALVSIKNAKIYDFKKKKVWEVDFDEETYKELDWDSVMNSSDIGSAIKNEMAATFSLLEPEFFHFEIFPIDYTWDIAGYKTKGVSANVITRFNNPFTSSGINGNFVFNFWMSRIIDKNDPIKKIVDFRNQNFGDSERLSGITFTDIWQGVDTVEIKNKIVHAVQKACGDTSHLYPLGIEIVMETGDPLNVASSVNMIYFSQFVVSVSENRIPDDIFEIPEGFTLAEEE